MGQSQFLDLKSFEKTFFASASRQVTHEQIMRRVFGQKIEGFIFHHGEGERSQKGGNFYWRGKQLYIKQIECKQRNRKARHIIYFNQSQSYISLLIHVIYSTKRP